jgi:hypothetical protein
MDRLRLRLLRRDITSSRGYGGRCTVNSPYADDEQESWDFMRLDGLLSEIKVQTNLASVLHSIAGRNGCGPCMKWGKIFHNYSPTSNVILDGMALYIRSLKYFSQISYKKSVISTLVSEESRKWTGRLRTQLDLLSV